MQTSVVMLILIVFQVSESVALSIPMPGHSVSSKKLPSPFLRLFPYYQFCQTIDCLSHKTSLVSATVVFCCCCFWRGGINICMQCLALLGRDIFDRQILCFVLLNISGVLFLFYRCCCLVGLEIMQFHGLFLIGMTGDTTSHLDLVS